MLLIYNCHVRSIVEYAAPAWHNAITVRQSQRLERIQRVALKTIFGHRKSYRTILEDNKLQTLRERRQTLSLNFAKKALKHKKFKQWFKALQAGGSKVKFAEPRARYKRLAKAPIPFLTNLLNKYNGF